MERAQVRVEVRTLLREIRPDAVALVDAWGFSDSELQSALGRSDGKVYETLSQWARDEPLNQPGKQSDEYSSMVLALLHGKPPSSRL